MLGNMSSLGGPHDLPLPTTAPLTPSPKLQMSEASAHPHPVEHNQLMANEHLDFPTQNHNDYFRDKCLLFVVIKSASGWTAGDEWEDESG